MIKIFTLIVLSLVLISCSAATEVAAEPLVVVEEVVVITEDVLYEETVEEIIQGVVDEIMFPIDPIDEFITGMNINEKIGQLFIVRMPNMNQAERLIRNYHIGGFILFGSDVSSIEQVQNLTSHLQGMSNIPLFIAVDEEGGRVSRVGRLFPERSGSAFSIGQTGKPQNAYDAYYGIGTKLRYLGFNMNFAPVADVWSNPANTVIGDRSFGTEPELVAEMVAAAVKGLQSADILAVIKHFPGHGDTYEDSHYSRTFYHHDRARFDAIEAVPFKRGIEAGAEGVMMGHIITPQMLTETPHLPATFSSYFMEQILREEMGFGGLIITDALDMRALSRYYSQEEIVLNAFINGADILLMPDNPSVAVNAMVEAFNNGYFTEERLHESLRRILTHKKG